MKIIDGPSQSAAPFLYGHTQMMNKIWPMAYRTLFVLPPAQSIERIRDRVIPKSSISTDVTPLRHPIDEQYGIETSGVISYRELQSGKPSDIYNICYGGSQPSIIRQVLELLPDRQDLTFLDLGCGKGRALAVASEFPFRRIIGVELAPSLTSIAKANAQIIGQKFPLRTPIEVIEGDAITTRIPDGVVVIYFFHPFYRKIMKAVKHSIENWLISKPMNKCFIIYYNPMYFDLYDNSPLFQRTHVDSFKFDTTELGTGPSYHDADDIVAIWQSVGKPMLQSHPQAMTKIQVKRGSHRVMLQPDQK
jgi:SAM-dependent methyltransferase